MKNKNGRKARLSSMGRTTVDNYRRRFRMWTMEALPSMPADQWRRLSEWVYRFGMVPGSERGKNDMQREVTGAITRRKSLGAAVQRYGDWLKEAGPTPLELYDNLKAQISDVDKAALYATLYGKFPTQTKRSAHEPHNTYPRSRSRQRCADRHGKGGRGR